MDERCQDRGLYLVTKTEIMDYVEKLENRIAQNERNIEYLKGRVEAALTLVNDVLENATGNSNLEQRLHRLEEGSVYRSGALEAMTEALHEWKDNCIADSPRTVCERCADY